MRPLYEISMDLQLLMIEAETEAIENEGEISDILYNKLEALEVERDLKTGDICRYYKSLNAEADMIKQEEKNLADRRKVVENKAGTLKRYLSNYIENGVKYSDKNSKISWRKSESLVIKDNDIDLVPPIYQVVSTVPNKTELKRAIKCGDKFEGISLVTKQNIQIK